MGEFRHHPRSLINLQTYSASLGILIIGELKPLLVTNLDDGTAVDVVPAPDFQTEEAMHTHSRPSGGALASLREQILRFACGAHDFELERDDFEKDRDWSASFIVKWKSCPIQEQLFMKANAGEHHIRVWLEVELPRGVWKTDYEQILQKSATFDVALFPIDNEQQLDRQRLLLGARAWVPNFSQRIFGLTLSNLMDCKSAIDSMCSKP